MASKVTAIIPARKGSKRVSGKNTRDFLGKPLWVYSYLAAKASPEIDRIILSTDDPTIVDYCKSNEIDYIERDPDLSTDNASSFDVLKNHLELFRAEKKEPEYIVLLQPTSPLREKELISRGIKRLENDPTATSLISVYEVKQFTGSIENGLWKPDFPEDTRSQDIPPKAIPSGSLYIYKVSETIDKNDALGVKPLALSEPEELVVNIDYESDFQKLELVYKMNKEKFNHLT